MRRFRNTLIVTVVASSLIVTPVLAAPNINQIKKNKAATEQRVDNLKKNKAAAEHNLDKANDRLVKLLTDFAVLKKDIANQNVKIKKADKDLTKAKAIEEKQYREMLVRIKYMYEKGDESEAAALLGSEDFGEMINQAEYIQSVHKYDRKMLNEYRKTKEKVANLKKDLESEKADMEVMAEDYKGQEKELNATISTMKTQVKDFDVQLKAAQKKAEEEAKRLQEETRRMEQAEKERRQQEAKAKKKHKKPSHSVSNNRPSSGGSSNDRPSSGGSSNDRPSSGGSSNDRPSSGGGSSYDEPAPAPSNSSKGQQIANTGLQYLGRPYVYGGNSLTNGIDCSGFTSQIHSLCGVGGVPRTSGAQAGGGKNVGSLSNALPGDIVCYSGHVAIYIGGGQIVHASNPRDGVKISSATYRSIIAIRRYW